MLLEYQGKRVYGIHPEGKGMPAGGYGRDSRGRWWVACPVNIYKSAMLPDTAVQEHEDQTISVISMIQFRSHAGAKWSGYLRRGQWERAQMRPVHTA